MEKRVQTLLGSIGPTYVILERLVALVRRNAMDIEHMIFRIISIL